MDFKDIFAQLQSAVNEHPDLSAEEAIDIKLTEMGISEDTRSKVAEACRLIDSYQNEYDNLRAAKDHGKTRRAWLEHRLDKMTEQFPDEEKNVILAAIAKQFQKIKSWISNI